jgi:hypothetical protein
MCASDFSLPQQRHGELAGAVCSSAGNPPPIPLESPGDGRRAAPGTVDFANIKIALLARHFTRLSPLNDGTSELVIFNGHWRQLPAPSAGQASRHFQEHLSTAI